MTRDDGLAAFSRWARRHAISIGTDVPDGYDGDLAAVGEMIGDARVVGIGESQHHVGEFNRFRARLFRHLVARHDFTAFVFECGIIESRCAHDYVLGRHDDRDAACLSIESTFGMWREMQSLLDWMRDYNKRVPDGRRVRFYGMDGSQGWSGTANTVTSVHRYLRSVDQAAAEEVERSLMPLAQAVVFDNVTDADPDQVCALVMGLDRLVAGLQVEAIHYCERSGEEEYGWALCAAGIARQIGSLLSSVHADPDQALRTWWNIRDAGMAELVLWILQREGPRARIVIGAHNIHLQKQFAHETDFAQSTMGQHLAMVLPERSMVMMSGTSDESVKPDDPAREGSFQAGLAAVGQPAFALDLRSAGPAGASSWLDRERPDRSNMTYQPLKVSTAWDAVFFTRHVSLDQLSLPSPVTRSAIELPPGMLEEFVGTYDIDGIIGDVVVLRIWCENDRLVSDGADSDGELFPMHKSRLFAMSRDAFFWNEWPMELVFSRGKCGVVDGIGIRNPEGRVGYRGRRRV